MLAEESVTQLSLLLVLFLEVAQLGLVFFLDGVLGAYLLLQLFHRDVLHVYGVL